jgi:DNA-directed RNA polymerase subunit M/transcription elongation factor TFIIS
MGMDGAENDPREWPTLDELKGEPAGGGRVRHCPKCRKRLFYVTNTWTLADGTIRRLRKCWACGHTLDSRESFGG